MERCVAWGRYSSPKAATIDLDVSPTKGNSKMRITILMLLMFTLICASDDDVSVRVSECFSKINLSAGLSSGYFESQEDYEFVVKNSYCQNYSTDNENLLVFKSSLERINKFSSKIPELGRCSKILRSVNEFDINNKYAWTDITKYNTDCKWFDEYFQSEDAKEMKARLNEIKAEIMDLQGNAQDISTKQEDNNHHYKSNARYNNEIESNRQINNIITNDSLLIQDSTKKNRNDSELVIENEFMTQLEKCKHDCNCMLGVRNKYSLTNTTIDVCVEKQNDNEELCGLNESLKEITEQIQIERTARSRSGVKGGELGYRLERGRLYTEKDFKEKMNSFSVKWKKKWNVKSCKATEDNGSDELGGFEL